ncbi:hypothetical protein ACWF9G_19225 [Nocardia sp. NPDC055029]|uniref:hypothetical protein n=1 Tax=Nocardia sp. NPDC060259 TaxID=3347088 RepID=UPI0036670C8A
MNRTTATLLGLPAMIAGVVLAAAPAYAATSAQVNTATVAGSSSTTVSVNFGYACDANGPVRTLSVVAEDPASGALGLTRSTPNCTGQTITLTQQVPSLNGHSFVAGHTANVSVRLDDGDGNEVLWVTKQLTIASS